MPKKIPMRTCVGCGETKEKNQLIRVIRTPDGQIVLDRTGRANGRGAYLCDREECLEKAIKRKSLGRALGQVIPDEVYEQLRAQMQREHGEKS